MTIKLKLCACGQPRHTGNKCEDCVREYRNARKGASETLELYLRNTYNIGLGEYEAMLKRQGGQCAICGMDQPEGGRFVVDHDHACCEGTRACGACVRGLLCQACNKALGLFRDDTSRLHAAVTYLEAGRGFFD